MFRLSTGESRRSFSKYWRRTRSARSFGPVARRILVTCRRTKGSVMAGEDWCGSTAAQACRYSSSPGPAGLLQLGSAGLDLDPGDGGVRPQFLEGHRVQLPTERLARLGQRG